VCLIGKPIEHGLAEPRLDEQLLSLEGVACNLLDNEGVFETFRVAEYVPNLNVDLIGEMCVEIFIRELRLLAKSR
jgi:hypothetical protein